jgi:hypothetical protein
MSVQDGREMYQRERGDKRREVRDEQQRDSRLAAGRALFDGEGRRSSHDDGGNE